MRRVAIEAPAKVNLRLRVLARETGGYHALETLFCSLSLGDSLEVAEGTAPGVSLTVQGGVETGPVDDNLVVRAARVFYQGLGREPAVAIRLHKRIPSAAGLGGGSSDAAAALRALNLFHGEPFTPAQLLQWGSELGSDVSFFLCGSALALAWSRGERLLALPPLPVRPVLVAHPGAAMPTAGAFQRIAELRGGDYYPQALSIPSSALTDWAAVAELAANDFEPVADERLPQLRDGRNALRATGAEIALLAGSGASLFGVYPDADTLSRGETSLRQLGFTTWRAETLRAPPEPRWQEGEAGPG